VGFEGISRILSMPPVPPICLVTTLVTVDVSYQIRFRPDDELVCHPPVCRARTKRSRVMNCQDYLDFLVSGAKTAFRRFFQSQ
jgi:hypothetical protein